jgi:hypothetical protein
MSERTSPSNCRNCGEPLRGAFCSACGQSHRFVRLELRALIKDVLERVVRLDTPALRTIGELTVDPGRVGREYLVGRRIAYVHPFKYALATFVLAIVANLLLIHRNGVPSDPTLAHVVEFSLHWGQALNFAVMPVFAVCLYGLFSGPPRMGGVLGAPRMLEWIEDYILVLFALGHVALLQVLLAPFVPYLGCVAPALLVVLPIAYVSWMFVGVCRTSWWSTLLRVSVAFIAGMWVPATLFERMVSP